MILKHPSRTAKRTKSLAEQALRKIVRDVLMEMWSSFPDQYEIARIVTNSIQEMMEKGETKRKVQLQKYDIEYVSIELVDLPLLAALVDVSYNERGLFIFANTKNWKPFKYEKVYDTIVHELMHGNIFLQRYDSGVDEGETPFFYDSVIDINRKESNEIARSFAYALYSTYYQEAQSIVSQTYSSIKSLYKEYHLDVITKRTFINLLKRTNGWEAFSQNIQLCDYIERSDGNLIQQNIIDIFNKEEYHLNIDVAFVRKQLKNIRDISNKVLKKIMKNSLFFYNELIKDGKIK